jgi:hypothetical protein
VSVSPEDSRSPAAATTTATHPEHDRLEPGVDRLTRHQPAEDVLAADLDGPFERPPERAVQEELDQLRACRIVDEDDRAEAILVLGAPDLHQGRNDGDLGGT